MEEFSYEIHDELGMHARPAGMLAKLASGYKSSIMIGCEKKLSTSPAWSHPRF